MARGEIQEAVSAMNPAHSMLTRIQNVTQVLTPVTAAGLSSDSTLVIPIRDFFFLGGGGGGGAMGVYSVIGFVFGRLTPLIVPLRCRELIKTPS